MKYFQSIWSSCHVPFEYFLNMGVSYSLSWLHLFSAEIRCESGQSRLHMGIFGIILTSYFRHITGAETAASPAPDESSSLSCEWQCNARKTQDCSRDKTSVDEEDNLYKDCLWGISTVKTIFLLVLTTLNSISIINSIAVHIWGRLGNIRAKLNLIIFLPLRFDKTK